MERFKVGIIGAGHIARKMAHTLRDMEGVEPYAVASRNQENAEGFACEWGFTRAYGSYEDLADDPEVQLIYIATPHSHHFEQARMCLEKGKPVLCEKAFTANAEQLLQPQFTVEQLRELGIKVDEIPALAEKDDDSVINSLEQIIPGTAAEFDFNHQQLNLSIPQMQEVTSPLLVGTMVYQRCLPTTRLQVLITVTARAIVANDST